MRVKLSDVDLSAGALQPQPPRIGVVVSVLTGPPTSSNVVFEGGVNINIPDTALERVNNVPQLVIDGFLYTVARPAGLDASQEYTGDVVSLYAVSAVDYALVRTRNGMYYEQRISQLVRVDLEGVPQ